MQPANLQPTSLAAVLPSAVGCTPLSPQARASRNSTPPATSTGLSSVRLTLVGEAQLHTCAALSVVARRAPEPNATAVPFPLLRRSGCAWLPADSLGLPGPGDLHRAWALLSSSELHERCPAPRRERGPLAARPPVTL